MTTYRMDLAYDGTRYSGWQRLGGETETLQGRIEAVITRLLDEPVEIAGSGRTDAGVHARGQVVSFHTKKNMPPEKLMAQLNHYLPGDISVLRITVEDDRFHARYNAVKKVYRYQIWNAPVQNPIERRYRYHVPEPLDLAAMRKAADRFLGTHDFTSFTSMKSKKKSAVRSLHEITISSKGPMMDITFIGDGFLHHMVRILTSTLLEVGAGRMEPEQVSTVLDANDRSMAGPLIPPQGLILWAVDYGEGLTWEPKAWQGLTVGIGK